MTMIPAPHLSAPSMRLRQVHAKYQQNAVLHDIHLQIRPQQVTMIVGPNGCGKSSLLRCMAGLHPIGSGEIMLGQQNLQQLSAKQIALALALLPQSPIAPTGMRVANLVRLGRHPHQGWLRQFSAEDEAAVQAAMQASNVLDLAQRSLDELSGGQRQRCWLAMVLAQATPLLLLDEPTSMLDLGHQVELLQGLRALAHDAAFPRSVVIVMHDLIAAARYADQLVAMRDGRILAVGAPREIITAGLVRELFEVEVDILHAPGDGAPVIVPRGSRGAVWSVAA
mgnify:CR=1 FL=1